jgi:hypothetical protein
MRAYWIVPNRDQSDDVLASDGETMRPLRKILDPENRPEGFSHGTPAELLEKCEPAAYSRILFAQRFPASNNGQALFIVTTPAGLDSSGRVVHLGLLFILEPDERPRFELSYANLSKEDQAYARTLIQRMRAPEPGDVWAQSVRELSEFRSESRPATNVELDRSSVRFHSLYAVDSGGAIRKLANRRTTWSRAALMLVVLAVVTTCAFLYAR